MVQVVKNNRNRISTIVLTLMLTIGFVFSGVGTKDVYAATQSEKKEAVEQLIVSTCLVSEKGSIKYNNGTVRAYVKEKADSTYSQAVTLGDGQTIIYYNSASLEVLYKQAQKVTENAMVGEKLDEISGNINLEANTGAASTMLGGFQPIVELVIGGIIILISFGMTLYTSFDIAYIALPIFRNKCSDMTSSGQSSMMVKKTSNGESKMRFVTDEALFAVQTGTLESGKNPWSVYLKARAVALIFVGITQSILLTGNITILTSIAVKLVAGVLDILTGLAS